MSATIKVQWDQNELRELLPLYLNHNLECLVLDQGKETIAPISGIYSDGELTFFNLVESYQGFDSVKPIMYPLSALNETIVVDGYNEGKEFVPFEILGTHENNKDFLLNHDQFISHLLRFFEIQKLISWHFWIGDQSLIGECIIDKSRCN